KSDTGDDRLPQNPVGGGVGKYDKVELRIGTKNNRNYSKRIIYDLSGLDSYVNYFLRFLVVFLL
ncbi:hypothetical protein, partial [Thiolapillus sp.]